MRLGLISRRVFTGKIKTIRACQRLLSRKSHNEKLLLTAIASSVIATSVSAADLKIGVSMALFDDNFLTTLRNGIQSAAKEQGLMFK